jgi:hypothetical protein
MEGIGGIIRKKGGGSEAKKPRAKGQLPGLDTPDARGERHIHSEAHALAAEISAHFAERAKFALYLAVIRRMGVPQARTLFSSIKSGDAQVANPRKFFMWASRRSAKPPAPKPKKPRKPRGKPKGRQLDMSGFLG